MDDTDRDVGLISTLCLDKFKMICYNVTEVLLVEPIGVFDIFGQWLTKNSRQSFMAIGGF